MVGVLGNPVLKHMLRVLRANWIAGCLHCACINFVVHHSCETARNLLFLSLSFGFWKWYGTKPRM